MATLLTAHLQGTLQWSAKGMALPGSLAPGNPINPPYQA